MAPAALDRSPAWQVPASVCGGGIATNATGPLVTSWGRVTVTEPESDQPPAWKRPGLVWRRLMCVNEPRPIGTATRMSPTWVGSGAVAPKPVKSMRSLSPAQAVAGSRPLTCPQITAAASHARSARACVPQRRNASR